MKNDWIMDVLTDLRKFAEKNGLSELAAHLDEATLVAAVELTSLEAVRTPAAHRDVAHVGRIHGTDGEGRNAG